MHQENSGLELMVKDPLQRNCCGKFSAYLTRRSANYKMRINITTPFSVRIDNIVGTRKSASRYNIIVGTY